MKLYLIEDKLTAIGNDSMLGLEHSEISPYYSWILIKKQYPHKITEASDFPCDVYVNWHY
jgi:hypothetical protein